MTLFTVTFRGKAPDPLRVGDEILLTGSAIVQKIEGELVDITSIGGDPKVTLGETSVGLFANRITITQASQ